MEKGLQNKKGPEGKMTERMDQCDLCSGELNPGKTTLDIWHDSKLIIIQDISADVCEQCGEAYLTPGISEKLDQFLAEYHKYKPKRYIPVPQFSAVETIGV